DFKVAGTTDGITAIQLDVKIPGLTIEQIAETLQRAREARLEILEKMLSVIPEYRKELSEYAPKIEVLKIPVEKIGELIIKVIALIRKMKSERKISLKTQLKKAIIYVRDDEKEILNNHLDLIAQVCLIDAIEIKPLIDESEIKIEIIN
ncbi:MAG: hypothetical protein QXP78_04750, partial [Candidatus Bathyarchaeia archaeon]